MRKKYPSTKEHAVKNGILSILVISTSVFFSGCSGEDYSGVYFSPGVMGNSILSIDGDEAKYLHMSNSNISNLTKFDVSYSSEKIFLDEKKTGHRYVLTKSVNERGLDCLDCRPGFPKKFALSPSLNAARIDAAIQEQQREEEAKALAAEERRKLLPKLVKFEGDWVSKRNSKHDPLKIMSISPSIGVKFWSFNFDDGTKYVERDQQFNIDEGNLIIITGEAYKYEITEKGQKLRCASCDFDAYWVKADPEKINNLSYAKGLAGNPN